MKLPGWHYTTENRTDITGTPIRVEKGWATWGYSSPEEKSKEVIRAIPAVPEGYCRVECKIDSHRVGYQVVDRFIGQGDF